MVNTSTEIIRVARPVHWVKNFALFAAIIFSGNLFVPHMFESVVVAFISFSLASSAGYVFNDILDVEQDRLHPNKKNRPIAAGNLSLSTAYLLILFLVSISLSIASRINPLFFFSVAGYLALQAAYSLKLKHIAIIDILVIASGFIIRVYAGAFVVDAHLSVWFLLCVISTALFLASGKRRAEMGVISKTKITTRKSLNRYSETLLDSYVTMFANAAWMSWALYTFYESPSASQPVWLFLAEISRTTTVSKLLMLTIPVVIFGIMRYESLIFEDRSEAPEKLLLSDRWLVAAVSLWSVMVVWILYSGVSVS